MGTWAKISGKIIFKPRLHLSTYGTLQEKKKKILFGGTSRDYLEADHRKEIEHQLEKMAKAMDTSWHQNQEVYGQ